MSGGRESIRGKKGMEGGREEGEVRRPEENG